MNCIVCNKLFHKQTLLDRHYKATKGCLPTKDIIKLLIETKRIDTDKFNSKELVFNLDHNNSKQNQNIATTTSGDSNIATTTSGDSNIVNSTVNSNNVTVNININSYYEPDVTGLKLISDLMMSWDEMLFRNFKLIYMNKHKPENQSIFMPTYSKNDVKVLEGDRIKVMHIKTALKEIESTIIELASNYVEDCKDIPEHEKEQRLIRLDDACGFAMYTRDFTSRPRNVEPELYNQIMKQRKELLRKIKYLLIEYKDDIELKKQEKSIKKRNEIKEKLKSNT